MGGGKSLRWGLLCSASAVLFASGAAAQSADRLPVEAQTVADVRARSGEREAASPSTTAGVQDSDIVVTAQRRSESLQKVPISVSALTAAQLQSAGVNATQDLGQVTPGLNWGRSTSVSQPTIRGVGSRNVSAGDETNVATYIDGVYQPEAASTLVELSNIERIEVLKGPQGTLFGRNATGGAINIVTRKPDLLSPTGNATLSYGRFNYLKGAAYVSVPLVAEKVGVGVAATVFRDDGYLRNVFLNRRQGVRKGGVVRGKLLLQPSDAIEIQINGMYSHLYDETAASGQPLAGNSIVRNYQDNLTLNPLRLPLSVLIPTAKYTTSTYKVPYFRLDQYMVDAHLSADLGFATLDLLGAHNRTDGYFSSSSDGSPLALADANFVQTARSWIEEATLASPSGQRLTWLLGVQAFQAKSLYDPLELVGRNTQTGVPTTTNLRYGVKTNSIAGFVEATYELLQDLFLTGGLRFTREKKTSIYEPIASAVLPASADATFKNTSPRAVVRWQALPELSIYGSFTRGFKSGTFNSVTRVGALNPAREERISAYEIGFKSNPARGVTINAAAFHYRYTDLQTSVVTNNPTGPGIVTLLLNAPEARINGAELEGNFQLDSRLRATLGVSLLDPKIIDFKSASVAVPRAVCPTAGIQPPCGNVTAGPLDVSGNDLIRAPRFTLNVGLNYALPVGNDKLVFDANAFLSGKYFFDLTNRVKQPAYEIVNGSITYVIDERLRFSVFGQNLTNNYTILSLLISSNLDNAAYQKPRWFGVSAGYSF